MTFDRGMVETALALVLGNLFGRPSRACERCQSNSAPGGSRM